MNWQATRQSLDAGREHWQFGPIDLVLQAWGEADAIARARHAAWARFETVLPELAGELAVLRRAVEEATQVNGGVAQRMLAACRPHAGQFITPMAAVAGAVADEICRFFAEQPGVRRAYVNNGGDIALHLRAGESLTIGVIDQPQKPRQAGAVTVTAAMPVRGIATSGWRGRSFSLGIADSVTVLAGSAAAADAAATMIANAVNIEHPAIVRAPASALADDTDLGARLVTVDVPCLPNGDVRRALQAGKLVADDCRARGIIDSALLLLQGQFAAIGASGASGAQFSLDAQSRLAA